MNKIAIVEAWIALYRPGRDVESRRQCFLLSSKKRTTHGYALCAGPRHAKVRHLRPQYCFLMLICMHIVGHLQMS